jgi:hypothetical protein
VEKQKMRARPLANQDFLRTLYTGKLIQQVLITLPSGQEAGREPQERNGGAPCFQGTPGCGAPCFQGTPGFGYT